MNRVNELYSEWQALQPLKPEDKKSIGPQIHAGV